MATDEGPSVAPTLSEDEATLARYAEQLGDAFAAVAGVWLRRLVEARSPGLPTDAEVSAQLDAGAVTAESELRQLLLMDIADQPSGPLEILRRAVRFPTEVLISRGVATTARDEFSINNFPDDVYHLTPASFSDIDPSLHEPGLMWGAAKAHVHFRRRREAAEPVAVAPTQSEGVGTHAERSDTAGHITALSVDLMDRSKIGAVFPEAVFVRSPAKLVQAAVGASLVLVDLARLNDPAALLGIDARVVAFGSHVDDEALAVAKSMGAEALPRSVFFRRLENGDL